MTKGVKATIREYLAKIGSQGGKMRAKRHSQAELSQWAQLGGRPKIAWSQLSESGKRARVRRARTSTPGGK
jgi:hypothetical protein